MQLWNEEFWLAISFVIFVYLAYKPVRRSILNALDAKIDSVKSKLAEAQQLKKDAQNLLREANNKAKQLGNMQNEIIETAKKDADFLIKRRSEEIERFTSNKIKDAEKMINQKKLQAADEIKEEFLLKATKLAAEYFKEAGIDVSDNEIADRIGKIKKD